MTTSQAWNQAVDMHGPEVLNESEEGEILALRPGLCGCGCGGTTKIAHYTNAASGWVRGQPRPFKQGHHSRVNKSVGRWRGGRSIDKGGYIIIHSRTHPYRASNNTIREHILVAEKALGKYLKPPAEIHHINEITGDNRPSNLVVCQDHSYHMLLHARQRARDACGNPAYRRCRHCKQYDDVTRLRHSDAMRAWYHPACVNAYNRAQRQKKAAT